MMDTLKKYRNNLQILDGNNATENYLSALYDVERCLYLEHENQKDGYSSIFDDPENAEQLVQLLVKHMKNFDENLLAKILRVLSTVCHFLLKQLKRETVSHMIEACVTLIEKALSKERWPIASRSFKCLLRPDYKELSPIFSAQQSKILSAISSCVSLKKDTHSGHALRETVALQVLSLKLLKTIVEKDDIPNYEEWFIKLFPLLFDDDSYLRSIVQNVLKIVKSYCPYNSYMQTSNWTEIKESIKTEYANTLIKFAESNESDWSDLWCLMIDVLGDEIGQKGNTRLINNLLQVEEKAFKSTNKNTRCSAFVCWRYLVNKYLGTSLEEMPKKLKLFVQPLTTINAKSLEISRIKFDVWWDLILGTQMSIEQNRSVLLQFLNFYFGQCDISVIHTVYNNPNAVLPPENSARRVRQLKQLDVLRTADALAQILAVEYPKHREFRLKSPQAPLLSQPHLFVHVSKEVIYSVGVCSVILVNSTQCSTNEKKNYLEKIWKNLLLQVNKLLSNKQDTSSYEKHVEVVKDLFRLLIALIKCSENENIVEMCLLPALEMILIEGNVALPEQVLKSRDYYIGTDDLMDGTSLFVMLDILLLPVFMKSRPVDLDHRYVTVLGRVCNLGIGPKDSSLCFTQAVLKRLDAVLNRDISVGNAVTSIWILVAKQLLTQYVGIGRGINQGSKDEPDFKCIFAILMFPVTYSSTFTHHQDGVVKVWRNLLQAFQINVYTSALELDGNIICCTWCNKVLQDIAKKKTLSKPQLHLIASLVLAAVELIPFNALVEMDTFGGGCLTPENHLNPCLKLLQTIVAHIQEKKEEVDVQHLEITKLIVTSYSTFIKSIPRRVLLCCLMEFCFNEINFLLSVKFRSAVPAVNAAFNSYVEKLRELWMLFLLHMQGCLNVLKKDERNIPLKALIMLKPLLGSGSAHSDVEIRDMTIKFLKFSQIPEAHEEKLNSDLEI